MQKTWLQQYPAGVPAEVDCDAHPSLLALLDESLRRHSDLPACLCRGRRLGFAELDDQARALAAYFQGLGLAPGDRVAVMLPNLPQYLVTVVAVLRAGLVVVNVDPQYSARELEHQLRDCGAKAIVVIENAAATLQQVIDELPLRHVLLASVGEMLGPLRGPLLNQIARRVRKLVPSYRLPGSLRFAEAVARGRRLVLAPVARAADDIAVLQYTGGTTGISKGAVLLHRNLVASLLQCHAWYKPALDRVPPGEQPVMLGALPLHHIFGFNVVMMLGLFTGSCLLLVPDAQHTPALLALLVRHRVHSLPGVEPLFAGLLAHPDFGRADWSRLVLAVGGGMAVQASTAAQWLERTGCPLIEGYGLSETSAAATCNPVDARVFSGSIGVPLPGTEIRVIDDEGRDVAPGTPGEIAIRGPQVMAGYWQRPDETARAMVAGGWLRSGDIGEMDPRGSLRIVDRKKDLIFVSGFNVYPKEIEELMAQMPGVQECAAVGVPDARAGEAVKLFVVRQAPASARPSEADVRAYCEANLSGYKRPKVVEFRSDLPRSHVGKVLRRALRDVADGVPRP